MIVLKHHHSGDNVSQDWHEYNYQEEQRIENTSSVSRHFLLLLINYLLAAEYIFTESIFASAQCLSALSYSPRYIRVREESVSFVGQHFSAMKGLTGPALTACSSFHFQL